MQTSYCDENLEIVRQQNLQMPKLISDTLAKVVSIYMDRLKTAADNTGWFDDTLSLISAVERAGALDGVIIRDHVCPTCGSLMRDSVPLSVQLLSNAIVYLLKRKLITPKSITTPSIETLNKEVAEGMTFSTLNSCDACGYKALIVLGPVPFKS